jgi:hypothetical protein
LRADHFGFTTADLPQGSTILGIKLGISAGHPNAGTPLASCVHCQLVVRGAIGGTDHAASIIPTIPATIIETGAGNDLWGFTPASGDLRDPAFGSVIAFQSGPTVGWTYTVLTQAVFMEIKVQY